jgi:hypothetical protein
MDPIGHGLENFDQAGRYRTVAPDDRTKTGCEITGAGDLAGGAPDRPGAFRGAGGLADRLIESGVLEACLATQLGHYLLGRELGADEKKLFDRVAARFRAGGHRFDQALLDLVTLPGFVHRVAE